MSAIFNDGRPARLPLRPKRRIVTPAGAAFTSNPALETSPNMLKVPSPPKRRVSSTPQELLAMYRTSVSGKTIEQIPEVDFGAGAWFDAVSHFACKGDRRSHPDPTSNNRNYHHARPPAFSNRLQWAAYRTLNRQNGGR